MHGFVRLSGLDKETRIFRFKNEWFYLLSGEYDDLNNAGNNFSLVPTIFKTIRRNLRVSHKDSVQVKPENEEEARQEEQVWLTTIVNQSGKPYLYCGIVYDFYFDKTGNLDKVILLFVHRRPLNNDRQPGQSSASPDTDSRYYEIIGDFFVLKYSEMSTINLHYLA